MLESQMEAWSKAGYRSSAHMLGYGRTAKPLEAEAYSAKNICNQLAAVMDHLQLDKVVVLGHDWGAAIAWRFALWFREAYRTCCVRFFSLQLKRLTLPIPSMSVAILPSTETLQYLT